MSYSVTFGRVIWGTPELLPILWDTALFTVFALHHSLFARTGLRAAVSRRVSPALERSVYVWAASLLLIAVCLLWCPVAGVAWHFEWPIDLILRLGQVVGISLTIRAAAVIDVWDLAGVRQRRAGASRDVAGEFKTSGPYGLVRHPIYLGWFLIVFSVPTMTMTRLVMAVVSSVYVLIAIPFEERSLRASSGGTYERYMQQVRWRVLPGIY